MAEIFSTNQIYFVVDNQTPFTLSPNSNIFADWGDFAKKPETIKPYTTGQDAGRVISSYAPGTGSAGIIGFSLKDSDDNEIFIRLLGSNSRLSLRKNWAYVAIYTDDPDINQDSYNKLHKAETRSVSIAFASKTIYLKGTIDQATEATATFALDFY